MRESERFLEREAGHVPTRAGLVGRALMAGKCPGYVKHIDKSATSFFFTNLPEGFKVSELYNIF